jgi:hypothetical protein
MTVKTINGIVYTSRDGNILACLSPGQARDLARRLETLAKKEKNIVIDFRDLTVREDK